jgi:hypothetical protein
MVMPLDQTDRTMLEKYQGILEMMQPDNGEAAN